MWRPPVSLAHQRRLADPSEAGISMYADDTTVLAANTTSVNLAIQYFQLFCSASGASLNLNKCEAMFVLGTPDPKEWPAWLKIVDQVKICGVSFGDQALQDTEDKLRIKMEKQWTFSNIET
jgi:Reverse transcriptase (RNA-dependent DNA polymerase)